MATEEEVVAIRALANSIEQIELPGALKNPDLGSLNFSKLETTFAERIKPLCQQLLALPIELIPTADLNKVKRPLEAIRTGIKGIEQFDIGNQNSTATRDTIVNQVNAQSDALFTSVHSWIPILALRNGDVDKNIKQLNDAINSGKEEVSSFKKFADEQKSLIEKIVTDARESAGKVGVAVFTDRFENEAGVQKKIARNWLIATGVSGGATLLLATVIFMGWLAPDIKNADEAVKSIILLQSISSKFILLGIAITSSLWCGRQYSIHKNIQSQNQHRADALKTFEAFTQAANETINRDAVLIEAARAIFSPSATGFVRDNGGDSDSSLKVLEVIRQVIPTRLKIDRCPISFRN